MIWYQIDRIELLRVSIYHPFKNFIIIWAISARWRQHHNLSLSGLDFIIDSFVISFCFLGSFLTTKYSLLWAQNFRSELWFGNFSFDGNKDDDTSIFIWLDIWLPIWPAFDVELRFFDSALGIWSIDSGLTIEYLMLNACTASSVVFLNDFFFQTIFIQEGRIRIGNFVSDEKINFDSLK